MKTLMFFLSLGISCLSLPSQAMSIDCQSQEDYFAEADVVFEGRAIRRVAINDDDSPPYCWTQEKGLRCGAKVVTFTISQIHKGELATDQQTSIYARDACYCVGPYLEEGQDYIVYAKKIGDKADFYSMSTCATGAITPQ